MTAMLERLGANDAYQAAIDSMRADATDGKKRRHRTGNGARVNPDHITLHYGVIAATIVTALAAFLVSWNGLVAVAPWMKLEAMPWLLPVMLDVPIAAMTFVLLIRRAKGETVWLVTTIAYGLTLVSACANFLHVAEDNPLQTPQQWLGAGLAALAPVLVLVQTEVLAAITTKAPRADKVTAADEIKELKKKLRVAERALKKEEKA